MEKELKNRIQYLLRMKGCSLIELGGNSSRQSKLSRQINGNIGISLDTLYVIVNKFPDISLEWLLLGIGSMDKSDNIAPRIYTQGGDINTGTIGGSVIKSAAKLPKKIETNTDLVAVQAVLEQKDEAIALRDSIILELRRDKEVLTGILQSITNQYKK